MKRKALVRHLEDHGCEFLREGKKHTVYVNRAAQASSTIPRHREIKDFSQAKSAEISRCLSQRQHNKALQLTAR
jgi:predicted RNA binding protein YcfA (HicA-like mRNA interferase family)